MDIHKQKQDRKKAVNALFFIGIMVLTFFAIFHDQNLADIYKSVRQISLGYLLAAILLGIFFVSAEGFMIWYLLYSMKGKSSLPQCIGYSFIGFFYSGITPSATGGQPMQLYYMKKDGNSLSESSVVLMTVAIIYKFVLVVIGAGMLLFWQKPLMNYLGSYFKLYLLGMALNALLVLLLLSVMVVPQIMKRLLLSVESFIVRIRIWKASKDREERIESFIDGYQEAVKFLCTHKQKIAIVIFLTFVQRFSVFFLTCLIYFGFSLGGTSLADILLLQASVYIAVDMLPIPGAQGITEFMYRHVFATVFPAGYLMPSLCVTRGINFYFLLIVSLLIVIIRRICVQCHTKGKKAAVHITEPQ